MLGRLVTCTVVTNISVLAPQRDAISCEIEEGRENWRAHIKITLLLTRIVPGSRRCCSQLQAGDWERSLRWCHWRLYVDSERVNAANGIASMQVSTLFLAKMF